jgi:hypothetical protein
MGNETPPDHPWNTSGPMEIPFTDSAGNRWTVIDFYVPGLPGSTKKRVPISNYRAEARAFIPVDREGPIMIYAFDFVAQRGVDVRNLESCLRYAKPLNATPGERLNGGPHAVV